MRPQTSTITAATRSHAWTLVAFWAIALLLAVASLWVGARAVPWDAVIGALHGETGVDARVVTTLRAPRALIGLVVGAALGVAGALVQSVTRNPLADTGVLGVGSGAAFGVVLVISTVDVRGPLLLGVAGVCGALAALAAILVLAMQTGAHPVRVVLVGAALSTTLGAATSLLVLADDGTLDTVRYWSIGSIAGRDWEALWPLVAVLVPLVALAFLLGPPLDTLALGDDVARSLGTRVVATRVGALGAVALLAGLSTALAGPVGFLGLLAPHLARRLAGQDSRRLLPLSAGAGAVLLLSADIVGRWIAAPGELEVGIVIAMIGAPVLILIARRAGVRQL